MPCFIRSHDNFYLARQVAWDRTVFYFLQQNRTNFKETPPLLQQQIHVENNSCAESAIELAMASTTWSTERVECLIEHYEANSCLYDTNSKEYFNRNKRTKALQEISDAPNVPRFVRFNVHALAAIFFIVNSTFAEEQGHLSDHGRPHHFYHFILLQ